MSAKSTSLSNRRVSWLSRSKKRLSSLLSPLQAPRVAQSQASTSQNPSHIFDRAHDFVVNDSTFVNIVADNFMEKLLQQTIIGAEFDSSDRDPPPRCHPETRLEIIRRCLDFIAQCHDTEKLLWVVGPARVGKSAVMQMVTEIAPPGIIFAAVFLYVNGRRDGTKVIITVAYQLAVKCRPYRQFIENQIILDPSLLRKSLPVQFKKFVVEPFMQGSIASGRFLIVIDGLDECDNPLTQQKLLQLITEFCIACPTSPIAWIVASRPERHITSFFEKPEVRPSHIKEDMLIDSDEACEEVQRYLRDELNKIKLAHPTLSYKREWPLEHEFTTIASAAGGLFAYAATVVRYLGDPTHGSPATQLRRLLETIDDSKKDHPLGKGHPNSMAQLDALYKRILSNIPDDVMMNTRKLLLVRSEAYFRYLGFRGWCNGLGLTEDEAYEAVCHLYAVMKIPKPEQADEERLSYYHKSFEDFLSDFKRSGFSTNFYDEGMQLCLDISLRILGEVPYDCDGATSGEGIQLSPGYHIKGRCDNVSLSWPHDERFVVTDEALRAQLYSETISGICNKSEVSNTISESITKTTRSTERGRMFSLLKLRLEQFHDELTTLGKLKQVPLRALDYSAVCEVIELQFTSPIGNDVTLPDRWGTSCEHEKEEISSVQQQSGWSTMFRRDDSVTKDGKNSSSLIYACFQPQQEMDDITQRAVACKQCSRRLARYFINNPDQLTMVFVDSTQISYAEVTFVDPDDGVSEWRYRFLHSGPPSDGCY